jgi:hypothetical protein
MAATNRQDVEKEIKDLASVAEVAFKNISANIKDIFDDALSSGEKVLSSLSKDMQRNINSLAKESNNLIINQSRINKGLITSKDISKQLLNNEDKLYKLEQQRASTILSINDETDKLKNSSEFLKMNDGQKDEVLKEQKKKIENINEQYAEAIDYNTILVNQLKEQAEQTKLIEKRTGITAKVLMGLKKIPILGDILNIDKGLENMRTKALKTGNVFKLLGAGIKGAFEGIEKASVILGLVAAAKKIFDFIKGAMLAASAQTAEFRRNMGLTIEEAEEVRQRTFEISRNSSLYADTQGAILINQSQILKSLNDTNNALETQIDFTQDLGEEGKAMLVQDAILRDNLQLDEETRENIRLISLRTGEEVQKITKNTLASVAAVGLQKNIMLDNNKILSKAAKTTGELRSSFRGNTEEIAKGIAKLKLMGLTLEGTKKVAGGLLNFEESISAELEAELLTGKDINLERARAYALNRDYVNLGKELIRQGLTSNELANMNILQLEAQAAVFNMNGDELTDMVYKQEEFNALVNRAASMGKSIQNVEKKSLQEIYNDLKKQQASEEEIKKTLGDRLYAQKLAEDAQTKYNKVLEQAQETFSRFVNSKSLDKFADFLTRFVNSVNIKGLGKTLYSLADDVDIAKYNIKQKEEEISKEKDPKKKKQLIIEKNELNFDLGKAVENAKKKEVQEYKDNEEYSSGLEKTRKKLSDKINEIITLPPLFYETSKIKSQPENTGAGMGGTPLGKTDEMIKLLTQQNQQLAQQNSLLADIKDKKSYIGINGTVFGTTQENNSFVVS